MKSTCTIPGFLLRKDSARHNTHGKQLFIPRAHVAQECITFMHEIVTIGKTGIITTPGAGTIAANIQQGIGGGGFLCQSILHLEKSLRKPR